MPVEISKGKKLKIEQLELINSKYGIAKNSCILDMLDKFNGPSQLSNYIKGAYEINSRSQFSEKIKMDHILFKIIEQNYFSLFNLLQYKMTDKNFPKNEKDALEWSYNRSSEIQKDLQNSEETLSWFVNLKIPMTYWRTPEVLEHYSMLLLNLNISNKTKISKRRMHIFYQEYFEGGIKLEVKRENCIKLFWILLFEKLIGIDNKVIVLKGYESLMSKVYTGIINPNTKLFFLDFALYQNPVSKYSFDINQHHILAGDFTLTGPIERKIDSSTDADNYLKNRVFDFVDANIFNIFKTSYLSLWEQKSYISYLQAQFNELLDRPENECFYKNELKDVVEIHTNHIEVIDFYTFFRNIISHKEIINNEEKFLNDEYDYLFLDCIEDTQVSIYSEIIKKARHVEKTKLKNEMKSSLRTFFYECKDALKNSSFDINNIDKTFKAIFKHLMLQ